MGKVLELANQLPTVSRGYLITRDFLSAVGRTPRDDEYRSLRGWVDAAAVEERGAREPLEERLGELAGTTVTVRFPATRIAGSLGDGDRLAFDDRAAG